MKITKEDFVIFIKQNIKTILLALICSLFIVGGVYYFFFSGSKSEDYSDSNFSAQNYQTSSDKDKSDKKESSEKVIVDVKGAVKNPGVYESTKDKRVKDIIDEAGGLLEDADTSNINLSEKLKDQMVVYVLKNGEKPKQIMNSSNSSNSSNGEGEVININTATKEQLMKISGIGKTKAEAIIEYREKNGDFKNKEDITKVKGIGKSTFEKIKDKIEV